MNQKNQEINHLSHGHFAMLENNVGLSENRNLLAKKSIYEHLLFIDGDSAIPSNNYLNDYIKLLPYQGIIYGGRKHPEICPSAVQRFRWSYGKYKEDKTAKERAKTPYQSLIFNNTLIHKKNFEAIKFDRTINTYGHEDTMFAYRAKKKSIPVVHIDNPVIHDDIDENAVFLKKMHSSVQNLHTLYHKKLLPSDFVKLLKYYTAIKRFGLQNLCGHIYMTFEKKIHKNLVSNKPSLLFFDFFKIGYFCSLNPKK